MVRAVDNPLFSGPSLELLGSAAMSNDDKGDGPRHGELSPEEREAFRKRAGELGKRLDEVQGRRAVESKGKADGASGAGMAQAFRFATELIVGLGVGWFIGNALDGVFGTGPWLMITFLMLGFAASMLNVIRAAQRTKFTGPPPQAGKPAMYDDEDDK